MTAAGSIKSLSGMLPLTERQCDEKDPLILVELDASLVIVWAVLNVPSPTRPTAHTF